MSLPQSTVTEAATGRVQRARAITLIAAALFCLVRGLAYTSPFGPVELNGPVAMISWDGRLIWVWNIAWITAGILCIVDLVRRSTRIGLSLTIGLTFMWGGAYLASWALTEPESRQWLTGATMALIAVVIFGLVTKIAALRDLLEAATRETTRG